MGLSLFLFWISKPRAIPCHCCIFILTMKLKEKNIVVRNTYTQPNLIKRCIVLFKKKIFSVIVTFYFPEEMHHRRKWYHAWHGRLIAFRLCRSSTSLLSVYVFLLSRGFMKRQHSLQLIWTKQPKTQFHKTSISSPFCTFRSFVGKGWSYRGSTVLFVFTRSYCHLTIIILI